QTRLEETHALHLAQRHAAQALTGQQVHLGNLDDLVFAHGLALFLNADDDAAEGLLADDPLGVGGSDEFDLFAAGLSEEVGERRVLRQVEGEAFEGQIEGVAVVVGDGVDLAAAAVLEDEAFEEVVDVGQGEVEVDAGVAVDEALALEVADAAAEE